MKPKTTHRKVSPASLSLTPVIRKSLAFYLLSVVIVSAVCFFLGWRSLENIGTGFIYGSLGLVLFGILTLFGNTVPAQLSKLALPKYSPSSTEPNEETEINGSVTSNRGRELFLTSLICGALLFATGLLLSMT